MQDKIVVIGGGQAAVQLCLALRKEKVTAPVVILSEESAYPYHRPPLSKSYLLGETDEDKLSMRPESFYSGKDIEVELNTRVTDIDPATKTVKTETGSYPYQYLVIATGARPKALPIEGVSLQGIHLLRNLDESRAIKKGLDDARNVVVIGAGFIGLEFAAVANKLKMRVTVFDMAERVMARAVSKKVSTWFEETHRANGIELRFGESVSEFIGNNSVEQVKTTGDEVLECDLAVVGVGVVPNDHLAQSAGLKCDDGVVVNEFCETSVPGIYAAGDCVKHSNPFAAGAAIRLESIQNATDQARVIASAIAGKKTPYHSVPWFWSDQGENSLQMAGLSNDSDQFVVRGNPSDNAFSVFHFSGDTLQCVDSVNSPREHIVSRKLIAAGIHPSTEQAADSGFDLKTLLK